MTKPHQKLLLITLALVLLVGLSACNTAQPTDYPSPNTQLPFTAKQALGYIPGS